MVMLASNGVCGSQCAYSNRASNTYLCRFVFSNIEEKLHPEGFSFACFFLGYEGFKWTIVTITVSYVTKCQSAFDWKTQFNTSRWPLAWVEHRWRIASEEPVQRPAESGSTGRRITITETKISEKRKIMKLIFTVLWSVVIPFLGIVNRDAGTITLKRVIKKLFSGWTIICRSSVVVCCDLLRSIWTAYYWVTLQSYSVLTRLVSVYRI